MTKPKRPRDPNQLAKLIVGIATGEVEEKDPNEGKDPAAVALGRKGGSKGGKKRAEKMSEEQRSAAAREAVRARWDKHRLATVPAETSPSRRRRPIQKVRAKIPSPED